MKKTNIKIIKSFDINITKEEAKLILEDLHYLAHPYICLNPTTKQLKKYLEELVKND